MTRSRRRLLAGAVAAVALTGCTSAAPDGGEPKAAGSSAAVVAEPTAPPVSEGQQKQAQQLAEEAEKVMLDPNLAPKDKYPKALGMFRDALEIDPGNALSQDSIRMIEDIYRSMGRPVPEST